MNKHHQWLARQLPLWVSDELISNEQAKALQSRYPVKDILGLGRLLLTGVGAIMIGLGVILLFAYNWDEMGKYAKLGVIFGALIGSHASALLASKRNTILAEGLFALGTMLMGAAIFLVGQVYHLDSHYPDAFLLWSAGALALAWARPSLTQAFMAIVLVISWHTMEVFDFQIANHAAFLLVVIGIFPLVWRLNSPVLARFVSASLLFTIGLSIGAVNESLVGITLLMISATLIFLEQISRQYGNDSQKTIANELAKPALLVLVVLLLMLSFEDLLHEIVRFRLSEPLTTGYFWAALLLSQLGFAWLVFKRKINAIVALSELTLLLVLLPSLISNTLGSYIFHGLNEWLWIFFNLVLLAISVWMMTDGAMHANRRRMVRGSVLFAMLAMARYTDLFDSLIARAMVFLILGIALFAVGNTYQRNKKRVSS